MPRQLVPLFVFAAVLSACGTRSAPPSMADGGRPFPRPAHVAVLVLENRSYEQVIGSAGAPYINRLARRGALATRYYAIAHPSLPNYIALTGGAVFGVKRERAGCGGDGEKNSGQLDGTRRPREGDFEGVDSGRRPRP